MLAIFIYLFKNNRLKILVSISLLFSFNPYFSQKASLFENITESEGLPSNYIFCAAEDQNSTLWLGTDKGLITYQDGKWLALDVDTGMPGNYINKMIADNKNGLVLHISELGLYFFNTDTKTLMKRYNEIDNERFVDIKKANKNHNFIIVKTLSPNNNESKYYAFDRNKIYHLSRLIVNNNQNSLTLENGLVISDLNIFQPKNKLVVQDYLYEQNTFGIIRKNKNNKEIDTLSEENGLASNYISDIFKRNNGDIFITTLGGGISILRKNNPKLSFLNKTINVRDAFYVNKKKYILSDGYLYILGKKNIEKKYFLRKDALSFHVSGNELILGSFEGLHFYSLEPELRLLRTYPITTGISKIIKKDNKIIFSTYGYGIKVLENNKLKTYLNKYFNNIENMFESPNGYIITSYKYGACLLDKNFKVLNYLNKEKGLKSNFVNYAYNDADSTYISTKRGVTVFDKDANIYKLSSNKDFGGNIVRYIFRDKKNKIWILTDKYLYRKYKNSYQPLGSLRLTDDPKDRVLDGVYSPNENELLIITKNKFSIFNLEKVIPNKNSYPVILEKIILEGNVINPINNIKFTDTDKNIYFIFKSVDKEIFSKSRLFYKINKDPWRPFTQPRTLKLYHLERGHYTLQVKSINDDGYENYLQKPIKFKVIGPFFIRWWFIMLSGVIVSLLIYNYVNERNKRKYVKGLNDLRIKHQIENERKRISRDLHDNIGAYVTSLISKIDLLKTAQSINSSDLSCDDVRLDAEHILALLRQTIFVLGNKETNIIALYDNFKAYALKFLQTNKIRIIFEENIENNRNIDPTTSSGIFRIMQEALQNIHKHANATKVEVNVVSKLKMVIFIKDNGKGFNQNELKTGFGLKNMKERAVEIGFKFNIYSDDSGTTIELLEI